MRVFFFIFVYFLYRKRARERKRTGRFRPIVSSLRKYHVLVATEPIGAGNAGVARRQKTFAVCRSDPHSAVKAVSLAALVPGSGPITQAVGAGEVGAHFPLPGRFGESRSMRLVQHRDDATSPPYRLMTGDLLHHQPLEGSRNVVLSDVVRRGLLGKIVEHVVR